MSADLQPSSSRGVKYAPIIKAVIELDEWSLAVRRNHGQSILPANIKFHIELEELLQVSRQLLIPKNPWKAIHGDVIKMLLDYAGLTLFYYGPAV